MSSIFSDSFGLLSAFFSGCAIIGVVITIRWQQQDSTLRSFESNLYKQIEFFLNLTKNLSFKNPDGADPYEGTGREIFEWFYMRKRYFI